MRVPNSSSTPPPVTWIPAMSRRNTSRMIGNGRSQALERMNPKARPIAADRSDAGNASHSCIASGISHSSP